MTIYAKEKNKVNLKKLYGIHTNGAYNIKKHNVSNKKKHWNGAYFTNSVILFLAGFINQNLLLSLCF